MSDAIQVGDWVEVKHKYQPMPDNQAFKVHKIEGTDDDDLIVFMKSGHWFMSRLLRKLSDDEIADRLNYSPRQDLNEGDWVQVIGNPSHNRENHFTGRVFQIRYSPETCRQLGAPNDDDYYSAEDLPLYVASSLRKMHPDDAKFEMDSCGYNELKTKHEIYRARNAVRDILAPLVDDRLAEMEERIGRLENAKQRTVGP